MSMNCWEYKRCGREPGGTKEVELGVCPAACESSLDAFNNGKNAGRACWIINATLCGNQVQGNFFGKLGNCMKCSFLKSVFKEEGANFSYGMKHLKS